MTAKERYKQLHEQHWAKQYPIAYADKLYFYSEPTGKPRVRLNKMIKNYLDWMGHDANIIETKGTAIIDKKHAPSYSMITGKVEHQTKIKYGYSATKTGTHDILVQLKHPKHPFGVPWNLETKIKDSISPEQKERHAEIKAKGFLSDVVRNMDEFFAAYDRIMKQLDG